jgi:ParB-like chromosome segregation protein Spo0J
MGVTAQGVSSEKNQGETVMSEGMKKAGTTNNDPFEGLDLSDETQESAAPASATAPAAAAPTTEPAQEKKKRGRKPKVKVEASAESKKGVEEKNLSPREKAVLKMLRRAGIDGALPAVDHLLRGKQGTKVKVKDIALFIGSPNEEPFKGLAKEFAAANRTNLSWEVNFDHTLKLGAEILQAGRMFSPITVAKITEDGKLEPISGRHRLAFLALAYGSDVEVPVILEEMDLNTARDAVVVANMARPTKAMERAEHAVLAAVAGNADAKPDELYSSLCKSKLKARKYCVYTVIERKHPCKLGFPVSLTSSRKDGGLTTVSNVEGFWGAAVKWASDMERKEFDASLKAATEFLNEMGEAMQGVEKFDPKQHLAAKAMVAIGKYYLVSCEHDGKSPVASKVAKAVVALGDIGRQTSEKIYAALTKALQK